MRGIQWMFRRFPASVKKPPMFLLVYVARLNNTPLNVGCRWWHKIRRGFSMAEKVEDPVTFECFTRRGASIVTAAAVLCVRCGADMSVRGVTRCGECLHESTRIA